jgi:hypothetical protein
VTAQPRGITGDGLRATPAARRAGNTGRAGLLTDLQAPADLLIQILALLRG